MTIPRAASSFCLVVVLRTSREEGPDLIEDVEGAAVAPLLGAPNLRDRGKRIIRRMVEDKVWLGANAQEEGCVCKVQGRRRRGGEGGRDGDDRSCHRGGRDRTARPQIVRPVRARGFTRHPCHQGQLRGGWRVHRFVARWQSLVERQSLVESETETSSTLKQT
jgi:hypothetical protein